GQPTWRGQPPHAVCRRMPGRSPRLLRFFRLRQPARSVVDPWSLRREGCRRHHRDGDGGLRYQRTARPSRRSGCLDVVRAPTQILGGSESKLAPASREGTTDGSFRLKPMSPRAKRAHAQRESVAAGRGKRSKAGPSKARQFETPLAEAEAEQAAI